MHNKVHVDRMLLNAIIYEVADNNPRNLQEILNRHTSVASREFDA